MKLLEIGSYPPPNNGWSVRIKYLRDAFEKAGHDCNVLNLGKYRKIKSPEYIDVQNGFDYLKKLISFRLRGYHFHVHMNAQAVKGPILSLMALIVSLFTLERAALTFHGGIEQLYFPKKKGGKMYGVIYLNFILSKVIVCNNRSIQKKIAQYGPFVDKHKIHPIPAFSVQYLNYWKTELPEEIEYFIQAKKYIIVCYMPLREGFFIETLIDFLRRLNSRTGVILTGIREVEDEKISDSYRQLQLLEEQHTILTVHNLDHDQFMTLLGNSDIYLRTPVSDGVASSVLEALSQKVPVVASQNGRRPASVITYDAENANDLEDKIAYVLNHTDDVKRHIVEPEVQDTVRKEVELLVGTFQ